MPTKRADLAGSWYPGDEPALAREVDACVAKAGVEYARTATLEGEPTAIIAPHAGLAFSGAVAAAAFNAVRAGLERVDVFVVFGAVHRARLSHPAIWPDGVWETPLGDIAVDDEFTHMLIDDDVVHADATAFPGDNAIELQTPFIKRLFPEARMVPVAMPYLRDAWRVGERVSAAARRLGRAAVAIASTDLTHYGEAFGVLPAGMGEPALEWTRRNDERFLRTLTEMDLDAIVPTASRDGSACGAGAAAAAAGWSRERGCSSGRLLAHTNSHEVMPRGEAEHFVGYASIVYEMPKRR